MRALAFFLVVSATATISEAGTPAVSAGGWHSLALHADGTVRAWGDDSAGALGIGRSLISPSPTVVQGLSGVRAVAAGGNRTVALKTDGTVWSWGSNENGVLGDGTITPRSTPVQALGLTDVQQIAAGRTHTVARKSDGTVWTWGSNYNGELGEEDRDGLTARAVPGMSGVVEIAAGVNFTIARKSDGTVWAWGVNDSGQLGDGAPTPEFTGRSTPVLVNGLTDVMQISAGGAFTVARKVDGSLWAWGSNHGGELGDGTTIDRSTPVQVIGFSGVAVEISAGVVYTLARKADGTVWAWGAGDFANIDGNYVDRPAAVQISALTGVSQLAAGFLHSVAARSDGGLWAWGSNGSGQLGDGTTVSSYAPIQVPGLTGVRAAAVGIGHTVALKLDGTVLTWGDNSVGQLGNAVFTFRTTPALVEGLPQVTAVAGSLYQSFALAADGSVFAWGSNYSNIFLDNSVGHSTPQRLAYLSNVAEISAGFYHAVARLEDGSVRAWGSNDRGTLGGGDDSGNVVTVSGLSGVTHVAAGGGHTLAVKSDGTVWAWGQNDSGQLGDGTTTDRFAPVQVVGISNAVKVAAGPAHSLALLSDGTVVAWGYDYGGAVGDGGPETNRMTPVRVPGLSRVSAIAAGRDFSLALIDGNVWAWGVNYNGGLGCPDCDGRAGPVQVPGLARIASIATRAFHVLALRDDGSIFSWGGGTLGQLGDGTLVDRESPVTVLRVGGGGSIAANDWFLDLDPAIPSTIPADKIPVFLVTAAKSGSGIEANIQFRAQDVGNPIFVFGYVPASRFTAAKDGPACVLAQLNPSGQLTQVSASGLQAYASNVTTTMGQAVTVLSNLTSGSVSGATFCVGSASTATQSVSAANNMCIVTVPAAAGGASCDASGSGTSTLSQASYEGLWLKGDESGWGVNVTHQGTTLFATWFTYDTDGSGMWLVASSVAQTSSGNFSGALYRTVGSAFSANPFNSIGPANYTTVGTISFSFTNANNGTMSYTVNGVSQSKAITRFIYATGGTNCTLGGAQGSSPNYQDLWLRSADGSAEAGWGINITHQGDILFATWFTYQPGSGSTNKGLWLVMSNGGKTAPGVYTGDLQTTTGPAFSAVPFNSNIVARTTVGTGTFTFTDANNGTFRYTVNGVTQSKPIARFVYSSPTTTCQ